MFNSSAAGPFTSTALQQLGPRVEENGEVDGRREEQECERKNTNRGRGWDTAK